MLVSFVGVVMLLAGGEGSCQGCVYYFCPMRLENYKPIARL